MASKMGHSAAGLLLLAACVLVPGLTASVSSSAVPQGSCEEGLPGCLRPPSIEVAQEWAIRDESLDAFVKSHVPASLEHNGAEPFDKHLKGVQAILRHWGAEDAISDAGLFHSIYGSEGFQGYKLPLSERPKLRELIGDRAERLVFIFSMCDRESVDNTLDSALANGTLGGVHVALKSRVELGHFPMQLTGRQEYNDFLLLSLADYLEQVEGAATKENPLVGWKVGGAWGYRREAYAKMARYLAEFAGWPQALAMHKKVYAREPEQFRHLHTNVTPPMSEAARAARAVRAAWDL